MQSIGRAWCVFVVCFLLIFQQGCVTQRQASGFAQTGDPLIDGPIALEKGPPEDRLLWKYRMAAAALRKGQWEIARNALDEAVQRLLNLYGTDPSARKARSLFGKESAKFFVGEPYERAMAFYYRGILYWKDGQPDNARACFRSAQLMDALAEGEEYKADFVLFDYLDGLISFKLGSDGSEYINRARKTARLAVPPDPDPSANVFIFIEYGKGPLKYSTGVHGEQLRFKPGVSRAKEVKILVSDQLVRVGPYDDLYFQATTRGGRPIDYILRNKVVFKETTDILGTGAIIGGVALSTGRETREAGLAMLASGLVAKLLSSAVQPQADVRCWDNLPLYLSFAFLRLPAGFYEAKVEFLDAKQNPLEDLEKKVRFWVRDGNDKVLFVSDQSQQLQEQ